MGALKEQVALVTGGASGLGAAIVERYVSEGAKVTVLDRSEQGCRALQERFGDSVCCSIGDVRSLADNTRAVEACVARFGRLDVAVGNAGIWDYNIALRDLDGERLAPAFDEMFQINLLGYLNLAKASLAALTASKGSMIFTASNAAFWPSGGGVLYTATKHAVVGLIRQLAWELAPDIRVNGVAPGGIATALKGPASLGMDEATFPGDQLGDMAADYVPLGILPTPEDYAGAYVFFANRQDNVPSTGTILNHDGGFAARGLSPTPRGGTLG